MEPRGALVSLRTSENEVACRPCLASNASAPSIICSRLVFILPLDYDDRHIYYDGRNSHSSGDQRMPMIYIYATAGTFKRPHDPAQVLSPDRRAATSAQDLHERGARILVPASRTIRERCLR